MFRSRNVAGGLLLLWATSVHAETWEQQAERLQNVSAAMLDDMPFAEVPIGLSNILAKSNISLLPKTNPTIGGKTESVPSSPVHTVPTLQVDISSEFFSAWTTGIRVWGGYLPAGSEKLVGLKAALSQRLMGASWIHRLKLGLIEPAAELGIQKGNAKVSGAITASDANDEFIVVSQVTYASVGIRIPSIRTWFSLLAGKRHVTSDFYIPADDTRLQLVDENSDGGSTLAQQIAAGIDFSNGLQLGVGQLLVPRRLTMTRVLVGWKVEL